MNFQRHGETIFKKFNEFSQLQNASAIKETRNGAYGGKTSSVRCLRTDFPGERNAEGTSQNSHGCYALYLRILREMLPIQRNLDRKFQF